MEFLRSWFKSSAELRLENLALRHQLGVLRRSAPKRLKLTPADRVFWVCLRRVWSDWKSALVVVKPATVIAWHRKAFRLFWTWTIRPGKRGRPAVPQQIRVLIRMLSRNNPLWGAPRIHGELLKLGIEITEPTVAKYMLRRSKPPSQSWRTFLDHHVKSMVSVDFFTVPTLRFQVLYVFLVLAHDGRRILQFGVTAHPTAEWTVQQLRNAFPWDSAPRHLLRDRDRMFGKDFVEQVKPWTSNKCSRRRARPGNVLMSNGLSARFAANVWTMWLCSARALCVTSCRVTVAICHNWRTHLSLHKDAPEGRRVQPLTDGEILETADVGGLHHHYERRAA